MTNVAKPEGTRAPMGQFVRMREYPNAAFRDVTARERRHALHHGLARRRQGAVGAQLARRGRPLLPLPDARRLDECLPGARKAHHRNRRADLRDHRPRWRESCQKASSKINLRRVSYGFLAVSIAPAPLRTTPPSTKCRTKFPSSRSAPTAIPTRRRPPPSDASIDMKTAVRAQVNALSVNDYFTLLAKR